MTEELSRGEVIAGLRRWGTTVAEGGAIVRWRIDGAEDTCVMLDHDDEHEELAVTWYEGGRCVGGCVCHGVTRKKLAETIMAVVVKLEGGETEAGIRIPCANQRALIIAISGSMVVVEILRDGELAKAQVN